MISNTEYPMHIFTCIVGIIPEWLNITLFRYQLLVVSQYWYRTFLWWEQHVISQVRTCQLVRKIFISISFLFLYGNVLKISHTNTSTLYSCEFFLRQFSSKMWFSHFVLSSVTITECQVQLTLSITRKSLLKSVPSLSSTMKNK